MTDLNTTDTALCEAYTMQLEIYSETIDLLEKAIEPGVDPDFGQCWVDLLDQCMARIAPIASRIAPEKAYWNQSGVEPSPRLRDLMDQLGDKIQQLKTLIEHAADSLQKRRDLLRPEVDQTVRFQQTRRAYQGV